MATAGLEYNFIKEPDETLKCGICFKLAKNPKQHGGTCGKIFCTVCIEGNEGKVCPSCNGDSSNYFPDAKTAREIQGLGVECSNLTTGCCWQGTIGTLDDHLKVCDIEHVSCKYQYVGCDVKMMRKDITKHVEEEDKKHLHLALQHITCTLSDSELLVFKITDYSSRKQKKEVFMSDPFYTHLNGYKMCFKIYLDGIGSGEGSHLSVALCVLKGLYDKTLQWPFSGIVSLHILNQIQERNHYAMRFKGNDGELAKPGDSWVKEKAISNSYLSKYEQHFWKDGSMYFRVTAKCSSSQPWLECGKRVNTASLSSSKVYVHKDPMVFKLSGYDSMKNDGEGFSCSPFFTSPHGYKMRIAVYPGGLEEGKGDHMSVYVDMLEGPHDNKGLSWPFCGTVEVDLLNQFSEKDSYRVSFPMSEEVNLVAGQRRGKPKFIKHTKLSSKYLVNDTLFFKVFAKADDYKSWLTCTP